MVQLQSCLFKEEMSMKKPFGTMPDGKPAFLYTITNGIITAEISDSGATLVRLFVPDAKGCLADVVLGFDKPCDYIASGTFFGATVGRNSNRIGGAAFSLNGKVYPIDPNDNEINNLHSGFDPFKNRLWEVLWQESNSICLRIDSPDGDQGFPGNAQIRVTYTLDNTNSLCIAYDAVCDKDTVFNMTNHSYFNLAGHDRPEEAMKQVLSAPARFFVVTDPLAIPTGELREVDGTPMDFRLPKPIGKDIDKPYEAMNILGGYDHCFEVFTAPCAILSHPESGRTMAVYTDCCGFQLYAGNFLKGEIGKDGVSYIHRGGVCLETEYYPDCVHHPDWPQPITKAGVPYHSETRYKFN